MGCFYFQHCVRLLRSAAMRKAKRASRKDGYLVLLTVTHKGELV